MAPRRIRDLQSGGTYHGDGLDEAFLRVQAKTPGGMSEAKLPEAEDIVVFKYLFSCQACIFTVFYCGTG